MTNLKDTEIFIKNRIMQMNVVGIKKNKQKVNVEVHLDEGKNQHFMVFRGNNRKVKKEVSYDQVLTLNFDDVIQASLTQLFADKA